MNNVEGNYYDKHNSKNPVVKVLMKNFHRVLNMLIAETGVKTVIDVGCGEGHTTKIVKDMNNVEIEGIEVGASALEKAKNLYPGINFEQGSIYEIKKEDDKYELALSTEVLEHLDEPLKGLNELKRVSRKYVIITVPNEPLWRIANMARLKYLKQFGNTPDHINHWSRRTLKKFLKQSFNEVKVKNAVLWNVALCRKQ